MKKEIRKHVPENKTPRIKYILKADSYCVTTWDENGKQKQVFYTDKELTKKI